MACESHAGPTICYTIYNVLCNPQDFNVNFMFKVKFNDGEHTCLFAELKSDVDACHLAIALHQSSTIEHIVTVVDIDDFEIVSLKSSK